MLLTIFHLAMQISVLILSYPYASDSLSYNWISGKGNLAFQPRRT